MKTALDNLSSLVLDCINGEARTVRISYDRLKYSVSIKNYKGGPKPTKDSDLAKALWHAKIKFEDWWRENSQ